MATEQAFARAVGAALKPRYGDDHLQLAEDANALPETAQRWLEGKNGPRGLNLLRLHALHPGLMAEIAAAIEGHPSFDKATGEAVDDMRRENDLDRD